ncbi:NAD(P)-dependent oxidoreductase [Diplocloster hominis]|uniref:NAD-dependent epimerase/dehydratase family protein n=1 Tax=Diplocloster hominis TaxID=3079010 RepID=UPI0031B9FCD8
MVIVIGATGFIGMYTVEAFLKAGKRVVATGRNMELGRKLIEMGADFIELDITRPTDFEKLPKTNIEGVILLAGLLPANAKADLENTENAADYFNINVLGAINVLEFCRKNGIKKVIGNCSYSDVSGSWGKGYPITEEEPRSFKFTGDHAVYVISKNACNDVMEYYNQQHEMQCAWFRFPPVYGVGPHGTIYVNGKVYKSGIATFIDNAIHGKNIELWGDPHIKRDIIYVKDVADAYVLALEGSKTYGLYNMTGGTQIDLEEQAKTVIELFGDIEKSSIIYRPEMSNNTPSFLYSMEKAKLDFGFVPKYKKFYDMMLDYKKELDSGRWNVLVEARRK